jgi:putative ABC transport system ATP-binding protein
MPLLSLQTVSKSFWRGPREVAVLKNVSLEVNAGELVAIYGQPNAGKTTLLKLAAGFETPDSGSVTFDGTDLRQHSNRRLTRLHHSQLGWVERAGPHSSELPMQTYVALPLYHSLGPGDAQRRAVSALAKVGAGDCADQVWGDLSDTARMLVAIAHVLVREPRLVIVDDPTAGLGIVDRERIVGLLREAAEEGGVGVLMAVPDVPSMLQAHQVHLLGRGRLLAPSGARGPDGDGNVIEFRHGQRTA